MALSRAWDLAILGWLASLAAAGRPPTTRGTRRSHLRNVAAHVGHDDPTTLGLRQLEAWLSRQDWSLETRRGYRHSLRSFYRWLAADTGCEDLGAQLPVVRAGQPRPRPTPERDYRSALLVATPRERLMVRLAAEVGLRRAEVAVVHSRDLLEDLTGWSLVVHGKGGRERVVPLPRSLGAELRLHPAGYVFPGDDGGHLSPRWVGKLVGRLLPDGWTMHSLRHRFATLAYGIDRDVFTVQELLGHASPATTRRYVLVENDALRRTVNAVAA